jgi:hypothetical protein
MIDEPSTAEDNGRDSAGRFAPGNSVGRGNPHARHVAKLRSALMKAVTPEDIIAIVTKMVELAKDGDLVAAKEVLTRTLGKPQEADLAERLEQLEDLAEKILSRRAS